MHWSTTKSALTVTDFQWRIFRFRMGSHCAHLVQSCTNNFFSAKKWAGSVQSHLKLGVKINFKPWSKVEIRSWPHTFRSTICTLMYLRNITPKSRGTTESLSLFKTKYLSSSLFKPKTKKETFWTSISLFKFQMSLHISLGSNPTPRFKKERQR